METEVHIIYKYSSDFLSTHALDIFCTQEAEHLNWEPFTCWR